MVLIALFPGDEFPLDVADEDAVGAAEFPLSSLAAKELNMTCHSLPRRGIVALAPPTAPPCLIRDNARSRSLDLPTNFPPLAADFFDRILFSSDTWAPAIATGLSLGGSKITSGRTSSPPNSAMSSGLKRHGLLVLFLLLLANICITIKLLPLLPGELIIISLSLLLVAVGTVFIRLPRRGTVSGCRCR